MAPLQRAPVLRIFPRRVGHHSLLQAGAVSSCKERRFRYVLWPSCAMAGTDRMGPGNEDGPPAANREAA